MAVDELGVEELVTSDTTTDTGTVEAEQQFDAAAAGGEAVESQDDASADDTAVEHEEAPVVPAEFSSDVLAKAEFYGFTAEEAKEFGTPEALDRALAVIDRRASAEARAEMERGNTNQEKPPETATTNSAADGSGKFEKFDLGINPEEFEPEVAKLLTGLNDHYHGVVEKQHAELAALKSQLSQVTGHFQAEAEAKFTSDMDTFFNGLPDTLKDVFGKGKVDELAPKGWHMNNRQKVAAEIQILAELDAKHGRKPATLQQLSERAVQTLFPDKLKTIARKEVKSEVDAQRKKSVARPSSNKDKPLSEDDALRKIYREWSTDKGIEE